MFEYQECRVEKEDRVFYLKAKMDINSITNLTWITSNIMSNTSSSGIFSGGTLIASFIISTIWFSYFIYWKKNWNNSSLIVWILMMWFPYFVYDIKYMIIIAVILCVLPFFVSI